MIRILHVVNKMDRGGLESFIMNVFRNINRNKFQFDFLTHTGEKGDFDDEIVSLGGKIYNVPQRNRGIYKNRKKLNDFFCKHPNYDIVHMHSSSLTYITPLIMAKKNGIKTRIIHGHSSKGPTGIKSLPHSILHNLNQKRINKVANHYFSCSKVASEWMYGSRINTKDIRMIQNAINVEKFEYNEKTRKITRETLLLNDKFVIGHVGRFAYPKNHVFLIEVFKEILLKNSKARLLLVGDGQLRKEIEKEIESCGLADYVIFMGIRTDISNLLNAMDVFVFPSLYEGLPVTLIEAQSTGLKSIVSRNITTDVKLTENIEYLSLDESPGVWAEKVLRIQSYNKNRKTPHEIKKSDFDIKKVIKDFEDLYENFSEGNYS